MHMLLLLDQHQLQPRHSDLFGHPKENKDNEFNDSGALFYCNTVVAVLAVVIVVVVYQ